MKNIEDFKKEIDSYLFEFLENKIESLPSGNSDIDKIWGYLFNFLKGGKRIRSYIAYLGYKFANGKDDKAAIKLFISIELFHAFCLIHDDIMDEAQTRHGMKTIHEFAQKIKREGKQGGRHYGQSQAILVGDSLLAWTLEVIFTNKDFNLELFECNACNA